MRILAIFACLLAGGCTAHRAPTWKIDPPPELVAFASGEFDSFLMKVDSKWNEKLADSRKVPKGGTSLVLVLVPDEGRKLKIDRIENVSNGMDKAMVAVAVEAVREMIARTSFSEELYAAMKKAGEIHLDFHYQDDAPSNPPTRPHNPERVEAHAPRLSPSI